MNMGSYNFSMSFVRLFVLTTTILMPLIASGEATEAPSAQELFQSGLQAYNEKRFDQSRNYFQQAFEQAPENKLVLYNWGLAAYQNQNLGLALAVWRRALYLDPGFSSARAALDFVSRQHPLPTGENSTWDELHARVLSRVSIHQLLGITLVAFLIGGWLMISYGARRKQAIGDEQPLPRFPVVGTVLSLLFVLGFVLSVAKIIDMAQPRSTVITQSTSVHTGPNTEDTVLFELPEGAEVQIKREREGWAQVGGADSAVGWVKAETLFQTSGLALW